ncbi:MAG: UDP-N-acetylmuramoyl-tripeptide--D-alanyl-D-alanine ligase [Chloroflexales bacterium]|nr:UDP-N-acetylmuramoyl-tripeptide--D-alanyl-D-alanine ligase [Chloroflexales bacterium]
MLSLVHVLFGVQPKAMRQMPRIPAAWQTVGFSEVVVDSREVVPGALFVALDGERTNGHNFLVDAVARGASGALVQRDEVERLQAELAHTQRPWTLLDPANCDGLEAHSLQTCLFISVDDPLMALQRLAVYHRRQHTPTVVGITGSVGKTSTKEVVAAILSRRFRTLKSKRSYNSEATMPTTLLQITPDHEVVVLEMGMWAPGEIRFLANLAWPYIGIVTNVGPSHLERVKSIDVVEQAKSELPDSLPPDGIAILNIDDERVARMARRTLARVFSYGLNPSADVWADQVESHGLQGITFDAHHANETVRIKTPLLGKHSVYTALAGIAIGLVMGMNWDDIIAGLQDENSVARIVQRPGLHGSTIIDDTYNAAPVSAIAALDLLAELDGRRIAALGDMLELGAIEEEAHRSVGRRAAAVVQELICVGQRARWIADEAQVAGMTPEHIKVVDTNNDVVDALQTMLRPGDYVLVKGSRGAAMESIVAAVQRHPEE